MNILRYIAFSKIILDFSFPIFLSFFQLWKISPPGQGEVRQGSRRSATGVKKKCARGPGKVHQGSRKIASAEYHVQQKQFSLIPDALLLDSWRTFSWPLTYFSLFHDTLLLDLEGIFFRVEKSNKKKWNKNPFFYVLYLKIFIRFSG